MTDFLWHEVSDKEKEQISNDAKKIMESFSKKLEGIGNVKESSIIREEFERLEGKEQVVKINRDIFFENAPKKNKDKGVLIAEKGVWK